MTATTTRTGGTVLQGPRAAEAVRVVPTAAAVAELEDPAQYFLPRDPDDLLTSDPARRRPVSFRSAGVTLAGHLFRPPGLGAAERTPAVALCGPISSVKEQTLPHYAERLADAGYTALTFDPRNLGESEGEPRAHYDPNLVIEDYCNAVSYLMKRADVDPDRVAVVGVCMGGGYAVSTGARDHRVKAVVSIAGGYDIGGTFQQFMGVDGFASYYEKVNELVQRQYETGEVAYIPAIARSLTEGVPVAAMPNEEAYSYYDRTSRTIAPNWSPRLTAASLLPYFIYNAVVHAPLVAPTPLLIVHGTTDFQLLPEYAQQTYESAVGPKELVWIESHNHIEFYDQDPYVSEAAAHAIRFLDRHLASA
jgi:fermentation-respiration switch protein FrsA (DUF1100 family)